MQWCPTCPIVIFKTDRKIKAFERSSIESVKIEFSRMKYKYQSSIQKEKVKASKIGFPGTNPGTRVTFPEHGRLKSILTLL